MLFAVLVSSLLLTIGLSIFSISLKELAISTASRQSIHAFYAADSGLEYAKYHDLKAGDLFTLDTNSPLKISTTTDQIPGIISGSDGPNYSVSVAKSRIASSTAKIETTVTSLGYDSVGGDRLEREIVQIY